MLFAGLTVAISVSGLALFGLDFVTKLGIGSALGVLTTVLIANSLLHLRARAARAQGRPAQGAVPAPRRRLRGRRARRRSSRAWGRFVTNARRAPCSPSSCSCRLALGGTSALVRLGAADQGTQPKEQTAPPRVRPPRGGLRPRVQRADPDRRRHQRRPGRAAAHLRRRRRGSTASRPWASRS